MILEGIISSVKLLFSFDSYVYEIIFLSLLISAVSTLLSLVVGLVISFFLYFYNFPLKKIFLSLVNLGMGVPPVIVGLFIVLLFWRGGVFGDFEILYTPYAMIIAQFLIACPMVIGFAYSSFKSFPEDYKIQIYALGAGKKDLISLIIREKRVLFVTTLMAAFGSVISEVGASLMVGGNIKGYTRVLTTSIVLETSMGYFDRAIALSIILLIIAFVINYILTHIQEKVR